MPDIRSPWVNVLAGVVGGVGLGLGVGRLYFGFDLWSAMWAVLGALLVGWAILDRRRFRRGTPESEVDGGRTLD